MGLGFLVVLLIILFVLYLFISSSVKPQVHVNVDGELKTVIDRIPSLKVPYHATPWLIDGNMQTMWGMRYRRSPCKCRREIFTFSDGGQCALDYFDPPEKFENPPILMILHTMGGGTREPCSSNLATLASRAGYRALVMNNRGCSGVPFTSRRFYCATMIDDIQAVVAHVRELHHPKFFFLHGFSAGAYMAIGYGVGDGGVDAISCVSHTFNGNRANECLLKPVQKRLYLPIMMAKLKHSLKKNTFVDYPGALKATTLDEFDRELTAVEYNIPDIYEHYDSVSIHNTLGRLKTRTLMICADNDPFTDWRIQPRKEAERSKYFAFVHVKKGGHVSFPVGFIPKKSWYENVLLEYYAAVMDLALHK
jgi:predicted alpha/beta-fold hydrolase